TKKDTAEMSGVPAVSRWFSYSSALDDINLAVIVAVIAVRVVQVPVNEVINVVAVRHRLVTAARAMPVVLVVLSAVVVRCAARRLGGAHRYCMLLDAALAVVVQVAVVQVVNVALVLDARVPATWAVLMVVVRVQISHFLPPLSVLPFSSLALLPVHRHVPARSRSNRQRADPPGSRRGASPAAAGRPAPLCAKCAAGSRLS